MRRCRWCASAMPPAVRRSSRCCSRRKLLSRKPDASRCGPPGTAIHQGGLIAKLQYGNEHRSQKSVRQFPDGFARSPGTGANVAAGAEIAVVDPSTEQVWEALRALYLIGQPDDLPAIRPTSAICQIFRMTCASRRYVETEKAIRQRTKRRSSRNRSASVVEDSLSGALGACSSPRLPRHRCWHANAGGDQPFGRGRVFLFLHTDLARLPTGTVAVGPVREFASLELTPSAQDQRFVRR
jgi:hypothetical protein